MAKTAADNDIAIIGMACVFPQAPNLRRYWANLVAGVDAIASRPADRWHLHSNFKLPPDHPAFLATDRGGYLPTKWLFDPLPFGVLPNLVRYGDPDQFLMLQVIDRALRDARVAEFDPQRERTDVIIGRGGYATGKLVELTLRTELYEIVLEALDRQFPELLGDGRRADFERYLQSTLTPLDLDNVSTAVSNITASRTANRLNLRGASYTVDGACASSLLATEQAVLRLRGGQCDMAVAAGLFLSLTPTFMYVFSRLGALSPSGQIRPFDRRADGLLAGEGGGAIVLKRVEDAIRDGDSIYAVIKGVGTASDGKEVDVLAPAAAGQLLALERAYQDAGVERDSISLLEMHGTGTVIGDTVELDTIKQFFGTSNTPPAARAMGSVKSMIGHTMPAAGMASMIKMALSLSNKIMPPSLHCEEPRPELADAPFYMNTQTRPWIHNTTEGPRRAGVNGFGFGGINAHIVLEEVHESTARRGKRKPLARPMENLAPRASELLLFSGASPDELRDKLSRVERFLSEDDSEATLAEVALALSREVVLDHSHKLALVCEDVAAARAKLAQCAAQLGASEVVGDGDTVYYATSAARHEGKIALVFPGMGFPGLIGNYPDHLMELCLHYPEVRAEFDFFENRDRNPDDTVPTSSIFSPPASLPEEYRTKLKSRLAPPKVDLEPVGELAAEERYLAAMGVTLTNWVGWVLVRQLELPVDMITGQSQGEMAAVCVAGVADFHESAPSFWKVLNIDPRNTEGHRLAFAWTSAEKVEPMLRDCPGVYLAIHMAPEGIILGGHREGLLQVAERLREEQILVQLLPYPAIHTPSLSHLREELVSSLGDADFGMRAPKIDMYSSITTQKYPTDPEGIRQTLMLNVDQPLRIWQTIRQMYADGARIFVQVGGGHMAAHLERLLPEGAQAITAALDSDTVNPLTQLNHLCATLYTAGAPMKFDLLFSHRELRKLDLDAPQPKPTPPRTAVPLRIDWSPLYSPNVPKTAAEADPAAHATVSANSETSASAHAPAPQPIVVTPAPEPPSPVVSAASVTATAPPIAAEPAHPFVDLSPIPFPIDEATARRLPVVSRGQFLKFVPEQELLIDRGLDLDEDVFLHDHLFVYADKPLEEKLPILPLTMSLEFLAEAAALLCPGMGLVGFENIRGLRWTGLRDCRHTDLHIEVRVVSNDEETGVRRLEGKFYFEGKPSFSATALFAPQYRQDVAFEMADVSGEGPWPITIDQVYGERYMFHGPMFHCMAAMGQFGNPAASAYLRVMPTDRMQASCPDPITLTDPFLIDGIGQVVGLWATMHEHYILPTAVDRMEFYGPTPPVGTVCPIRIEVLELNPETRQIRCNVEIEDGEGFLWVRASGWTEWLLKWTTKYADATRRPSHYLLSDELTLPGLPPGAVAMRAAKLDLSGIDGDWASRIFLQNPERREYLGIEDSRRKRQMLLSRIAAKDAARTWSARRHRTAYPEWVSYLVGHDERGAPRLEPAGDPNLPHISFSHVDDASVAVACDQPIGIDVEPIGAGPASVLTTFAAPEEITLIEGLADAQPDEDWPTRLWCAKEAVGKLLGIGLAGRPKDFEAVDVEPDGCFVIRYEPTGDRYLAHTTRLDRLIVACAVHSEGIAPAADESASNAGFSS